MNLVEVEEKRIYELSIRTTNATEMNPSTGKIGPLWQEFDNSVEVDYKNGNRAYGVYFDYESDANGEFSVLSGTDQVDVNSSMKLESVTIQSGKYLVFKAIGEVPKIVFETWGKVWEYFSKEDVKYERLYTTDFEYYVNQNELEIYIAVNKDKTF